MARPIVEHIVDGMQVCRRCKVSKSVDQFWKNSTKSTGLIQYCKGCTNLNHKECRDRQKNGTIKHIIKFSKKDIGTVEYKEHQRDRVLKKNYGITLEDYNKLFSDQKGCCVICNIHQTELKRPLDVDHNHKTGKVRGLLCAKCNTGIGLFNDNVELLNKVIEYLENDKNSIKVDSVNLN